jgi:hypothetical protein
MFPYSYSFIIILKDKDIISNFQPFCYISLYFSNGLIIRLPDTSLYERYYLTGISIFEHEKSANYDAFNCLFHILLFK